MHKNVGFVPMNIVNGLYLMTLAMFSAGMIVEMDSCSYTNMLKLKRTYAMQYAVRI